MNAHFKNPPIEWTKYLHLFKRQEVAPRTVLLKEGEVAKNLYYIEKGSLRLCFNKDGKDITFQFFFEGEVVSSIESFRTNQPGLYTVESIERSTLYAISKHDFFSKIQNIPEISEALERYTFQRLICYQKLFLSRIKDKPEERYRELTEKYPEIIKRIPQHYIASYLGITSVSLSRIRNRRSMDD